MNIGAAGRSAMRGVKMAGDPRNGRAPYAADPAKVAGPASPRAAVRRLGTISSATATGSSTRPPSSRLAHKTQVFVYHEGDHFRSRLTHTIEVAQLARALARALRLDEELTEAVALGHDHRPHAIRPTPARTRSTPCMAAYGGFDHNSHGLRLVTELERRYADFDGLNLTQETLEGLVKHNGPLVDAEGRPHERWSRAGDSGRDPRLRSPAEPSIWSNTLVSRRRRRRSPDDIAYDAPRHRRRPARRAVRSRRDPRRSVCRRAARRDRAPAFPASSGRASSTRLTRRVITRFIEDVIAESSARIAATGATSLADVQQAGRTLVGFSPAIAAADHDIKAFLFANMYRHPQVTQVRERADLVVRTPVCRLRRRPRGDAAGLGDQGWRERGGASARRRRLYRRHDRPLRPKRISPAF